jgi:hypothetical protein
LEEEVIPIFKKVLSRVPAYNEKRNSEQGVSGKKVVDGDSGDGKHALTLESRPLNSMGLYYFTKQDYEDGIGLYYNRMLFKPKTAFEDELNETHFDKNVISYLEPDFSFYQAEDDYLKSTPHVDIVDGAVSDSAMKLLRTVLEVNLFYIFHTYVYKYLVLFYLIF